MVSVQEWKSGVLAQIQDVDHVQTTEALAELLEGSSSPADIAKRITTIYEPPPGRREVWVHEGENHKVVEFWGIHMHEAISTFADSQVQKRLVDLLVEMSKQPDVKHPDGSVKGGVGFTYWRDLPDWDWQFSQYGLAYKYPEDHAPTGFGRDDYLNQAPGLLNLTRFAARLLTRNFMTCGLPPRASEMLHLGLEQTHQDHNDTNMKPFEWQVLIPISTTWLSIAGEIIYSHCLNDEVQDLEASADVQAGWGGATWTKQRWEHWKQQLHIFLARQDMSDECRDLAARAAAYMNKLEE